MVGMSGLTVDRHIPAPPERVWRALTDPAELATWFWPPRFETVVELDAREGGALRIASGPAAMAVTGTVTAVDPGHGLSTTWRWDGEDLETRVTIALTPGRPPPSTSAVGTTASTACLACSDKWMPRA
jgi:uncharacterized protein YndB with AHSA1/START domain